MKDFMRKFDKCSVRDCGTSLQTRSN